MLNREGDRDNWRRALPGMPGTRYEYNRIKDLVGYELFISRFESWGIPHVRGDFIEIGCFIGGGTAKLAAAARALGRKVFAVDIFEPASDDTKNLSGSRMSDIYHFFLRWGSQEELFRDHTSRFDNIVLLKVDSRDLTFPADQKFSFAFIDGNHDPAVVKSDFPLLWPHIVPGGVIGFHDYQGDLPRTTRAIDELLESHRPHIESVEQIPECWTIFVFKRAIT
jgi:predicted O-methyltransferase YrrM